MFDSIFASVNAESWVQLGMRSSFSFPASAYAFTPTMAANTRNKNSPYIYNNTKQESAKHGTKDSALMTIVQV